MMMMIIIITAISAYLCVRLSFSHVHSHSRFVAPRSHIISLRLGLSLPPSDCVSLSLSLLGSVKLCAV